MIDSRVKIIGNERPGAGPYDPRGRLHANNTKSIVLGTQYNTHNLFPIKEPFRTEQLTKN
jgi:hypothetical protein